MNRDASRRVLVLLFVLALWVPVAAACTKPQPSGEELFTREFTPEQGLGPLFNARSCSTCHASPSAGGVPADGLDVVFRVGVAEGGSFDELDGRGGPVARNHSVAELGYPCLLGSGIPRAANIVSTRNTPPLFGLGQIEAITDEVILNGAVPKPHGILGRPNWTQVDGKERVGRFGWKAQVATLEPFVAEALRNEMGITSSSFPTDLREDGEAEHCAGFSRAPEMDADNLSALLEFVRGLPPQSPDAAPGAERGLEVFNQVGCSSCHTPALEGPDGPLSLYSDLLLHDVGPALDDRFIQGEAGGSDWRTTPLWGLRLRSRYLHDGRSTTLDEAILAHGGKADAVITNYVALPEDDKHDLLSFLSSL